MICSVRGPPIPGSGQLEEQPRRHHGEAPCEDDARAQVAWNIVSDKKKALLFKRGPIFKLFLINSNRGLVALRFVAFKIFLSILGSGCSVFIAAAVAAAVVVDNVVVVVAAVETAAAAAGSPGRLGNIVIDLRKEKKTFDSLFATLLKEGKAFSSWEKTQT